MESVEQEPYTWRESAVSHQRERVFANSNVSKVSNSDAKGLFTVINWNSIDQHTPYQAEILL
jgi:hypothetical protein